MMGDAAMDDEEFAGLIAKARAGDGGAVERLLGAFEGEVRMMVRHRLPRALRSQFDSMDFVQAIWTSVFAGSDPDPGAAEFADPKHFLGYLAGVARNKVWQEHRRQTRSKKYDLAREERLYVRRGEGEAPRDLPAPDPTPSQHVQAADRLDQLVAGRTGTEAQVVELRTQGLTFEEIASRLGLHERTVRRVIEDLRRSMEARRWQ